MRRFFSSINFSTRVLETFLWREVSNWGFFYLSWQILSESAIFRQIPSQNRFIKPSLQISHCCPDFTILTFLLAFPKFISALKSRHFTSFFLSLFLSLYNILLQFLFGYSRIYFVPKQESNLEYCAWISDILARWPRQWQPTVKRTAVSKDSRLYSRFAVHSGNRLILKWRWRTKGHRGENKSDACVRYGTSVFRWTSPSSVSKCWENMMDNKPMADSLVWVADGDQLVGNTWV